MVLLIPRKTKLLVNYTLLYLTVHSNCKKGQLQIQDVAWDPSLGGQQFDYKLATHFVNLVKKQHKIDVSFERNPKAFARLLKEAQKIKEVLSANPETRVTVFYLSFFLSL